MPRLNARSTVRLPLTLLLCSSSSAFAQGTADTAFQNYQAKFRQSMSSCGELSGDNSIVVCGRRDTRAFRLPLPMEAAAGRRPPGEVSSAVDTLEAGAERCSTSGRHQDCGHVNLLAVAVIAAGYAVKAARIIAEDAEDRRNYAQ
jgi:hypothetical protein